MNRLNKAEIWDGVIGNQFSVTLILVFILLFAVTANAVGVETVKQQLPERKQTTLGLYVTAKEAYEKWKSAPDQIKIIDVRTPEEYAFIGHPEKVWNVPFAFVTYQRKEGTTTHGVKMNDDFVNEVHKIAKPTDILLLMCRSGDRSAKAVNQLAEAGFKNAYTITDGMEGDKVDDSSNVFHGKRVKNGWKNSGSPWVYSIDTDRILIPEGTSK